METAMAHHIFDGIEARPGRYARQEERTKTLCWLACALLLVAHPGLSQDTIQVKAGWNIIGTLSAGTVPEVLTTVPAGIIESAFYGYAPGEGYASSTSLEKGFGYWVKVSADGAIVFHSSTAGECGAKRVMYGGLIYHTIKVGPHCWLEENLDIGQMIDSSQSASDDEVVEKYCYQNDPLNCATFGGLYQWAEALQYDTAEAVQGICPAGWHIPTSAELGSLKTAVNDDGNALKAIGQGLGLGEGTNTSGFSGLLAGYRTSGGGFEDLGYQAYVWSSTVMPIGNIVGLFLMQQSSYIWVGIGPGSQQGYSVRCVED
jgi:uncharacterized protein (TIGR02145 family)